jgi:hypothetical protein
LFGIAKVQTISELPNFYAIIFENF